MLVLVQWAQQTGKEILGMSFSVTIVFQCNYYTKCVMQSYESSTSHSMDGCEGTKQSDNLKSNRLCLKIQLLIIYYDLYFRGLPRH